MEKIEHALKAVKYFCTVKYSDGLTEWLKGRHGIDTALEEEQFPGSSPEICAH
jgi:hypothetical protein